jgi:hypothetical protein
MPKTLKKTDNEAQWWGWSLPHTRFVITSFDLLAMLLGPEERRWPPSQPYKIPGEIRPRTKTLQHTLRSVILYQGSDVQIQEIERLMHVIAAEIEPFLKTAAVRVLVDDADEDCYMRGQATGRFYGAVGSTASRRRREGLHGEVKRWLLDEIKVLDTRVGPTLVKIENILRPPKMYVFNSLLILLIDTDIG